MVVTISTMVSSSILILLHSARIGQVPFRGAVSMENDGIRKNVFVASLIAFCSFYSSPKTKFSIVH